MERFTDRNDAAQQLIPLLDKYRHERGVVLAVPRGGVPIAYHIARHFSLPLALLMTKKIGHPRNPEYAIGAVSAGDHIIDDAFGIEQGYIDKEIQAIRKSLADSYKKFMGDRQPVDLENKVVIVVDDGVATGNTILSSIKMLRKRNPKKIVVAVPIAPVETVEKIKPHVDDFICLHMPETFIGVGLHYDDFDQVDDEEVISLLKDANNVENAA